MSDELKDAPKKKGKGKLIILFSFVLLFIGGGFFAIQMKGSKGKKETPKIELAEKETELEEFLTNTADVTKYVRAKIAVRLVKDFEETKLKDNMADVRDAVLVVLNATPPNDFTDSTKRKALKRRLASAMNESLAKLKDKDGDKSKDKDSSKSKQPGSEEWDSDSGPIMEVRFNAIATQ